MKGLSRILILSLIGVFERFSFYAIIGILFLFMTSSQIGFSNEVSDKLYGFFLKCIYFSPILLGFIADITNRKVIIGFGLIVISIGYLLIYFLSGSISGFYISLIITAIGISAYRPNIWVLIGDTSQIYNDKKLALQGYVLFSLLGAIGGFFLGFIGAYIRLIFGYLALFLTVSLSMIPFIILYFKKFFPAPTPNVNDKHLKFRIIYLLVFFIFYFLLSLGFGKVNNLVNQLIDIESIDKILEGEYHNEMIVQAIRDVILITAGLFAFGILFLKIVKTDIKFLLSVFLIGIALTIMFFIISHYKLEITITKSNRLFVLMTIIITLLDLLLLPVLKYLIYLHSNRFKGLAFGLFIAQNSFVYKYILTQDLGDKVLLFISSGLLILILIVGVTLRKKPTLLNRSRLS